MKQQLRDGQDSPAPTAESTKRNGVRNPRSRQKKKQETLNKHLAPVQKIEGQLQKLSKKGQKAFAGWAMSIMFFGMALKRTFDAIWKSSTKTFQDVMHSVEGNITSFDILAINLSKSLDGRIFQARVCDC